jgi:DNA-binding transcriptional MerR regulator
MTPTYRLEDLAAETGIESRTIRFYITQGLLSGPDSRGRGASYSEYHRDRLRAIKLLRDVAKLDLREIRKVLAQLGDDEIARIADVEPSDLAGIIVAGLREEPSSALDYIRGVTSLSEFTPPLVTTHASMALPPSEAFADAMSAQLPQRAKGEVWFRIRVTPDVELHVSSALRGDQLQNLERIADYIRHTILGGTKDAEE